MSRAGHKYSAAGAGSKGIPNRGSRPFPNLVLSSTAPVPPGPGSPTAPIVSPLVSGRTPSVHQQSSQVLQSQPSVITHQTSQFGGGIGLQQPPALRLERARPNEVRYLIIV